MEWYSFKKCIPVKTAKKSGITNLKEHHSFCMEQKTLVELLKDTQGQKPSIQRKGKQKNGLISFLDVTKDEQNSVLVNLHNANMEEDKLNNIDELSEMLKSLNNISAKQIILGRDLNLYLKTKWKSYIKKTWVAKMTEF